MRKEPMCGRSLPAGFEGRRIVVLGRGSAVKEELTRELQRTGGQGEQRFEVSEQPEISPEDYVILMGTTGEKPEKAQRRGTGKYPWIREAKEQGAYLRSWKEFRLLTDTLQDIRRVKPAAVVFVSDSSVYGKLFGEPHLIREDEIGYLCHTDEDSQDGQMLRMAEHLCGRLVREDGVRICIARLQNPLDDAADSGSIVPAMAEMLLRVLLLGVPGEPYNISGPRQVSREQERVSPLSPNIIIEELEKAESL